MDKNKVLILTIGGSPQPNIKSLHEHDAKYMYFLPSITTTADVETLISKAYPKGCFATKKTFVIDDYNSLISCYQQCYNVFRDIRDMGLDNKEIIADPTGGTKIMSAALLLAAINFDTTVSYVGSEIRTKDGKGIPINGTEKIYYSGHPFDIIAHNDKIKFCHYFNSYRFEAAGAVCDDMIAHCGSLLSDLFKVFRYICQGYRDWDHFRFNSALHQIEKGVESLRRLSAEHRDEMTNLTNFIKAVAYNVEYLEKLDYNEYNKPMIAELLANAGRRASEGKYDDAIARLYRALEMVAQWQFKQEFNQSTSDFPYDRLSSEVKNKYNGKITEDGKVNISSRLAFEQLASRRNVYGMKYREMENQIGSILNLRNTSILAHGTTPLDKGNYENLYKVFVDTFQITGDNVEFAQMNEDDLIPIGLAGSLNG